MKFSSENKNDYDEEGQSLTSENGNDFFWGRKNTIKLPLIMKTIILTNCQIFQCFFGIYIIKLKNLFVFNRINADAIYYSNIYNNIRKFMVKYFEVLF